MYGWKPFPIILLQTVSHNSITNSSSYNSHETYMKDYMLLRTLVDWNCPVIRLVFTGYSFVYRKSIIENQVFSIKSFFYANVMLVSLSCCRWPGGIQRPCSALQIKPTKFTVRTKRWDYFVCNGALKILDFGYWPSDQVQACEVLWTANPFDSIRQV